MLDPIDTLARTFAAIIRDAAAELDTENGAPSGDLIREINAKNATAEYAAGCASHDYFDANMGMFAAFEEVTGRAPDPASDEDAAMINAAWSAARAARFFA